MKTKTYYTAEVTFQCRNASGEFETKTVAQDVTDCMAEGADPEELADGLYWREVHGKFDAVTIVGGGVRPV